SPPPPAAAATAPTGRTGSRRSWAGSRWSPAATASRSQARWCPGRAAASNRRSFTAPQRKSDAGWVPLAQAVARDGVEEVEALHIDGELDRPAGPHRAPGRQPGGERRPRGGVEVDDRLRPERFGQVDGDLEQLVGPGAGDELGVL